MESGDLTHAGEIRYPRTFLRTLLGHHMSDLDRQACCVKRGGRFTRVEFRGDCAPACAAASTDGDDAAEWLPQAVDGALQRFSAESRGVYAKIVADMFQTNAGGRTSATLTDRLGIRHAQLPQKKHRARRAFLRVLERVVHELSPDLEIA